MDALGDRTRRAVRAGTSSPRGLWQSTNRKSPSSRLSAVAVTAATLTLGLGGSTLLGWLVGWVLLAIS